MSDILNQKNANLMNAYHNMWSYFEAMFNLQDTSLFGNELESQFKLQVQENLNDLVAGYKSMGVNQVMRSQLKQASNAT